MQSVVLIDYNHAAVKVASPEQGFSQPALPENSICMLCMPNF